MFTVYNVFTATTTTKKKYEEVEEEESEINENGMENAIVKT